MRIVATPLVVGLTFAMAVSACTGPAGDPGPAGSQGEPGGPGVACWDINGNGQCDTASEDVNEDGVCDASDCQGPSVGGGGAGGAGGATGGSEPTIAYVGSEVCSTCHDDHYQKFMKSGHPYGLTEVTAEEAPERPFDARTGGVPDPPAGRQWSDISYVIGGFGWQVRYVQTDGYILTGDAGDETQWNFANPQVGSAAEWVAYHAGEQKAYDCGSCHTTGWIPCAVGDDTCEHQADRAGMAGSFYAGGVQCEACHGPGIQHAKSPYLVKPTIDRSAEACGKCHRRADVERVDASGGFIRHNEQFDELFASKKHAMRCIDCHNPHQSAKFADATVNPNKSLRVECVTCHVGYDSNQKSAIMEAAVACVECHMPPMVKSAAGDLSKFTGDIRTHLFAINPDQTAEQFYTDTDDEEYSSPFITLTYACNHCHGVWASSQTLDDLELKATDYHQ